MAAGIRNGKKGSVRRLIDAVNAMGVVLNPDGIMLYANPHLSELLEVPSPRLEGTRFEELLAPRSRRDYRRLLQASASGTGSVGEVILRGRDGAPLHVQVSLRRLQPPEPDIIMLLAVDVTRQQRVAERLRREKARLEARVQERTAELVKANQALQEDVRQREAAEAGLRISEAKWRKLFEVSPAVITVTTLEDGRILEANEAFLRILGYNREEVIGRKVTDLGAWGDPQHRAAWAAELLRHGVVENVEAQVCTKAGEVRIGLVSSGLIEMDDRRVVLTVIRDITERKRAEEALRLSEERFMRAFRSCPAAMALSRPDGGRFVDVNDAFLQTTGYTREEVVGRRLRVWKHPDDRKEAVQELVTAGCLRNREYEFVRKSGETFRGLGAAELVEVGGEPLVLSLVLDITERKRAEERLRHALADKEALLREVHHRTKNNLQMLCDLLYLQAGAVESREAKDALQDTHGRLFAIARLHERLYHALESGQVRLADYLGRLVAGFEEAYGVPVRFEASGPEPALDLDRAIHTGLIANELITNALKHAFPAGAPGEVRVRLARIGDEVELEVRDSGRGLPPGFDVARSKSLGLKIVHILAQRLRAQVTVEGAGGASFTIRIPIEDRD